MAKCNISINFSTSAEEMTKLAEQAISGAGGSFMGNSSSGTFAIASPIGNVEGSYTVDDQLINLVIIDKPFLLSCNRIEEELRKYIK